MDDMWARYFRDLVDRFSGPMKFRLVLQPLMAAFFAIRSGLKDAKSGKPPFSGPSSRTRPTTPPGSRTDGRVSGECSCWRWCPT
jgi:hypothetical protein